MQTGSKAFFLAEQKMKKAVSVTFFHTHPWLMRMQPCMFTDLATTKSKTHLTIITLVIKTKSSYAICQLADPHIMEQHN